MPRPVRGKNTPKALSAIEFANANSTLNAFIGARRPAWLNEVTISPSQPSTSILSRSTPCDPSHSQVESDTNQTNRCLPNQHGVEAEQYPSSASILPSPAPTNELSPSTSLGGASPVVMSQTVVRDAAHAYNEACLQPIVANADVPKLGSAVHNSGDPASRTGDGLTAVRSTGAEAQLPATVGPWHPTPPRYSPAQPRPFTELGFGDSNRTATAVSSVPQMGSKRPASLGRDPEPGPKRVRMVPMAVHNTSAPLMTDLAAALDAQISSYGGLAGLSNDAERKHYSHLKTACSHYDWWYILFHCLLSQWSFNSRTFHEELALFGYSRESAQIDDTFEKLSPLVSGRELDPRHVMWFARFPGETLQQLRQDTPQGNFDEVMGFLVKFGGEWPTWVAKVSNRGFPMLTYELCNMQCTSFTMQAIVLTFQAATLGVLNALSELYIELAEDRGYERLAVQHGHPQDARVRARAQRGQLYKEIVQKHRATSIAEPSIQHVSATATTPLAHHSSPGRSEPEPMLANGHAPAALEPAPPTTQHWQQPSQSRPMYQQPNGHPNVVSQPSPPISQQQQQHPLSRPMYQQPSRHQRAVPHSSPPIPQHQHLLLSQGAHRQPNTYDPYQQPQHQFPEDPSYPSQQSQGQPHRAQQNQAPQYAAQQYEAQQYQQQWSSAAVSSTQFQNANSYAQPRSMAPGRAMHPYLHAPEFPVTSRYSSPSLQSPSLHQSPHISPRLPQVTPTYLLQSNRAPSTSPYTPSPTLPHSRVPAQQNQATLQSQPPQYGRRSQMPDLNTLIDGRLPTQPTQTGRIPRDAMGINRLPSTLTAARPPVGQRESQNNTVMAPQQGPRIIPVTEYPHDTYNWTSLEVGLHLARHRSPIREPRIPTKERFYQFVSKYAAVKALTPKATLEVVHFNIPNHWYQALVTTEIRDGVDRCKYGDDSLRVRLRVCKSPEDDVEFARTGAAMSQTYWPSNIYISLNDHKLQPRRKQHFRNDLPIEVTRLIREGNNVVVVSLPETPKPRSTLQKYLLTVELIKVSSLGRVKELIRIYDHFPKDKTKEELQRRLAGSGDDDIVIEDKHLSVSVADPFSATMCVTPVRGLHCKHVECFDLDNWLSSRPCKPSRRPGEPSKVDEWKCPICGCDARPHKLRIDDFFVAVREKLLANGAERTKMLTFDEDGNWTPVPEEDDSEDEEWSLTAQAPPPTIADQQALSRQSRIASVIILDDD